MTSEDHRLAGGSRRWFVGPLDDQIALVFPRWPDRPVRAQDHLAVQQAVVDLSESRHAPVDEPLATFRAGDGSVRVEEHFCAQYPAMGIGRSTTKNSSVVLARFSGQYSVSPPATSVTR